jgi:hypothetical protein
MNRETIVRMLERAQAESDPIQRGLLLAEAQVIASLVIMDRLEDITGHVELSAVNSSY